MVLGGELVLGCLDSLGGICSTNRRLDALITTPFKES